MLPGKVAPMLVKKENLKLMKKGSVIVDVAVDQRGCIETTHPTTHQDPIFIVDNIVHYCVSNMSGAVPRTATVALTNATIIYGLKIAKIGCEAAITEDPGLAKGFNTYEGKLTNAGVAEAFNMEYTPILEAIK